MQPIIEVNNLVKRYKKTTALAVDNISFSVEPGAFFTFLGPNGAGKTTTISILTTTLASTSGTALIAGFDIEKQSKDVRRQIGVIFQQPSLDKNLSAEENVRFHSMLYGIYNFRPTYSLMPDEYKTRVMELASILGIEREIFNPIKSFSGGMKRKLEIIRSLMHHPKVLFLDEPTTGLDPASRKNLWGYLQTVRAREQTTIFLTTHYLEEAEDADMISIINHGRIISCGTPGAIKKDLVEEYLLVDAQDRITLQKEVMALQLKMSDKAPFKISLNGKTPQEIISSITTPLTMLKIHIPTLEEAYLDIIDKENNNGNHE